MLELVVVLGDDVDRGLAAAGLSTPRAHLLWELRRRGPSTQRALADALGVSARAVTGLVDGLVGAGLVHRGAHPSDRRATLVGFTRDGERMAAALEAGHRELAEVLFAALPDDRLSCFVAGLEEVLARLHERLAAGDEVPAR